MIPLSLSDKIDLALLGCGILLEDDNSTDQDEEGKDSTRFIHSNEIDRRTMLQAMSTAGHTVSSLADAARVEPSMISRLLRKPINNDPDESARNPSVSLAARISSELRTSIEALFPDIYDDAHASSGGGGTRKNKSKSRKPRQHVQNRSDAKYADGQ